MNLFKEYISKRFVMTISDGDGTPSGDSWTDFSEGPGTGGVGGFTGGPGQDTPGIDMATDWGDAAGGGSDYGMHKGADKAIAAQAAKDAEAAQVSQDKAKEQAAKDAAIKEQAVKESLAAQKERDNKAVEAAVAREQAKGVERAAAAKDLAEGKGLGKDTQGILKGERDAAEAKAHAIPGAYTKGMEAGLSHLVHYVAPEPTKGLGTPPPAPDLGVYTPTQLSNMRAKGESLEGKLFGQKLETLISLEQVNEAGVTTQEGVKNGLPAGVSFPNALTGNGMPSVTTVSYDPERDVNVTVREGALGAMMPPGVYTNRDGVADRMSQIYQHYMADKDAQGRIIAYTLTKEERFQKMFDENQWMTPYQLQMAQGVYIESEENLRKLDEAGKKFHPTQMQINRAAERGVSFVRIDQLTKQLGLESRDGTFESGYNPNMIYGLMHDIVNYDNYNVPRDIAFTRLAGRLNYLLGAGNILTPNQLRDAQVAFVELASHTKDESGATQQMILGALQRGAELGFDKYVKIGDTLRPVSEVVDGKWVGKDITATKGETNAKVPYFLNSTIEGNIIVPTVAPQDNPKLSFYQIPGKFQDISEIPPEEIRDHNESIITAMIGGVLKLITNPVYAFDPQAKISVLKEQTRYETGDVVRIIWPQMVFVEGQPKAKTEMYGVEFDKTTGQLTGYSRGGGTWELATNKKPIDESNVIQCTTAGCTYDEMQLGLAILEVRELGVKGLIDPWGHPKWADKALPGYTFIIKEVTTPEVKPTISGAEIAPNVFDYGPEYGIIRQPSGSSTWKAELFKGYGRGYEESVSLNTKEAAISYLLANKGTVNEDGIVERGKLVTPPAIATPEVKPPEMTTPEVKPVVPEIKPPEMTTPETRPPEVKPEAKPTTPTITEVKPPTISKILGPAIPPGIGLDTVTGLPIQKQKTGFEAALIPNQLVRPMADNTPVIPGELPSATTLTVGNVKEINKIISNVGGIDALNNVALNPPLAGRPLGVPKGTESEEKLLSRQTKAVDEISKIIGDTKPTGQLFAIDGLKSLESSGYTVFQKNNDVWIFRPDGKFITSVPDLSLATINRLTSEFDKTKNQYDKNALEYTKTLNGIEIMYSPFIKTVMIGEEPITHAPIYGKQWDGTEAQYQQYLSEISKIDKQQAALKPIEAKLNNQFEVLTLAGVNLGNKNPIAQMANYAEADPGKFAVGFIPGVGTAVLWNEMDTGGKIFSIGTDVLSLVGAGILGKAMIRAGVAPWKIAMDVMLDATILPRSFNPKTDIPHIRLPSGFRTLETEVNAITANQAKVESILMSGNVLQQRATLRGMLNPDTQKVFDATMEIMDTLGDYNAPTKQLRTVADFSVVKNMPQGAAAGVRNVLGQISDIAEVRGSMSDWMQLNGIKLVSKPNDVDIVISKGGRLTKQEVAKQFVDSMNQSAGKTVARLDKNGHTVLGNVKGKWEKTLDIHYVGDFQLSEQPPLGLFKNRNPITLDGIKFEPIGNQIWHRGLELIKPGTASKLGLMGPEAFGKPWRVGDAYKFEVLVRTIIQNLKDTGKVDLARRMEDNLKTFMDAPRGKPLPWTPKDLGGIDQEFADLFKELQAASLSESRSIVAIHPTKGVLVSTATPAMNVLQRTLYTGVRDIRPYIEALKKGEGIPVGKILDEFGNWVDAPNDRIFTSTKVAFDRMYDIEKGTIGEHAGIIAIKTVDTDLGTTLNPSFRFETGKEFKGIKGKVFGKEFQFGKEETFPIRFDEFTIEKGNKLYPTTQSDINIKNPVASGLTGETVTRNPRTGEKVPMLWLTTEKAKQFGMDYPDAAVGMPTKAEVRAMNLLALKAKLIDILHPHLQKDIRFTTEKGVIGKESLVSFYQDNLKFVETSKETEKLNKQLQSILTKKELNLTKQQMAKEIADAYGFDLPEVTNTRNWADLEINGEYDPYNGDIRFRDNITEKGEVGINFVIHEIVHKKLMSESDKVRFSQTKGLDSKFIKDTREFNLARDVIENIDKDFKKFGFDEILDTLYIEKLTGYLDQSYLDGWLKTFEPKNQSMVLQVSQKYINSLNIPRKQDLATTLSKLEKISKDNLGKIVTKAELDKTLTPIKAKFSELQTKMDEALVGDLREELQLAHKEGIKSGKSVESILDKKVTTETKQIEDLINSNPKLRDAVTSNSKKLSDGYVVNLRTLSENIVKGAVPQIVGAISTVKTTSALELPSPISELPKVSSKAYIPITIPTVPTLPIVTPTTRTPTVQDVKGVSTITPIPTTIPTLPITPPTFPITPPVTPITPPTTPTIPTTFTKTIITPPVTTIPPIHPPKIPPPVPTKPPKFPPKKSGQEQFEMLTHEQKLASVAWKQGWIYHLVYPPYGPTNVLHSRFSFPGVKHHTGVKSAHESLARIRGNVLPEKIYWNMGAVDITFQRGKGKVQMQFNDYKQGQPRIRRPEGSPKPVATQRVKTPIATGMVF